MFRFLFSRKSASGLLTSTLYNERTFFRAFYSDVRHSTTSVLIESPFLTIKRSQELGRVIKKLRKRNVKVRINTREPRHHTPDLRGQAHESIKILKSAGARVYVCSDYRHRKLAVIDGHILWEGSLNIISQSKSQEIMRRTDSKQLATQMLRFTRAYNNYW